LLAEQALHLITQRSAHSDSRQRVQVEPAINGAVGVGVPGTRGLLDLLLHLVSIGVVDQPHRDPLGELHKVMIPSGGHQLILGRRQGIPPIGCVQRLQLSQVPQGQHPLSRGLGEDREPFQPLPTAGG
jgi:hypothetical protein